jgi:hypothetical protein
MFPWFAPRIAGVIAIFSTFLLLGSAQAVPVSVSQDTHYGLGSTAQVAANPDRVSRAGEADDVVTLPLPSAIILFVSALAGLGLLARRRRTPSHEPPA